MRLRLYERKLCGLALLHSSSMLQLANSCVVREGIQFR